MKRHTLLLLTVFVSCVAVGASAAAPSPRAGEEVTRALTSFLKAFENLDWEPFRAAFDDRATVFFPTPSPGLVEGWPAIEARFRQVFEETRRAAPAGPPYHHLDPENLHVEVLAPELALVTFELRNEQRIARRSIVFRKSDGRWLILHLHASNMAPPVTETR